MKTTESNKLIAEFMGHKVIDDGISKHFYYNDNIYPSKNRNCGGVAIINVFSKYWEFIMPVVEKIETLNISGKNPEFFIMYDNRPEFHGWYWNIEVPKKFKKDCLGREATKIEAVYNATIEFIKWYNKQKTAN